MRAARTGRRRGIKFCSCCGKTRSLRGGDSGVLARFTPRFSRTAVWAAHAECDGCPSDRPVREEVDTCRRKTRRERISRLLLDGEWHRAKGELTDIHVRRGSRGAVPLNSTTRPRGNSRKMKSGCAESGFLNSLSWSSSDMSRKKCLINLLSLTPSACGWHPKMPGNAIAHNTRAKIILLDITSSLTVLLENRLGLKRSVALHDVGDEVPRFSRGIVLA